jgi:hypothetical protein
MGTYFTQGADKAAIIAECVQSCRAVKHTVIGNHLWCIGEGTIQGKPHRYVILFKLENGGRIGWGYKPISEDMGPCYYDCPLEYVKEVETFAPLAYAEEWRAKVYARNGQNRAGYLAQQALPI